MQLYIQHFGAHTADRARGAAPPGSRAMQARRDPRMPLTVRGRPDSSARRGSPGRGFDTFRCSDLESDQWRRRYVRQALNHFSDAELFIADNAAPPWRTSSQFAPSVRCSIFKVFYGFSPYVRANLRSIDWSALMTDT